MTKLKAQIDQFKKAVQRLEEALEEEKNVLARDSAILRFQMSFDLCWKLIKTFLREQHEIECNSPLTCFREAYQQKLIENDDFWMTMPKMRNAIVHTYEEALAEDLYAKLPNVLKLFQQLLENLK